VLSPNFSLIPSWEELCQYNRSQGNGESAQDFAFEVSKLKRDRPFFRYHFARMIVQFVLRDHSYKKFADFDWADIIDLMAEQVRLNRVLEGFDYGLPKTVSGKGINNVFRPHNQLPCTWQTARLRVSEIAKHVDKLDPILLLGDDDLISIELAKQGFSNLTIVDIDSRVIQDVAAGVAETGVVVDLYEHDLNKSPPAGLLKPYRLILLDPVYSIDGINLFLRAGREICTNKSGCCIFLCVHLMSLWRDGLSQLEGVFQDLDLAVEKVVPGFNAYPVPKRLKSLICMVNQLLIGSKTLTTAGYAFPYFLSDAILLKSRSH
jgi:hypothetical protein